MSHFTGRPKEAREFFVQLHEHTRRKGASTESWQNIGCSTTQLQIAPGNLVIIKLKISGQKPLESEHRWLALLSFRLVSSVFFFLNDVLVNLVFQNVPFPTRMKLTIMRHWLETFTSAKVSETLEFQTSVLNIDFRLVFLVASSFCIVSCRERFVLQEFPLCMYVSVRILSFKFCNSLISYAPLNLGMPGKFTSVQIGINQRVRGTDLVKGKLSKWLISN